MDSCLPQNKLKIIFHLFFDKLYKIGGNDINRFNFRRQKTSK